MPAILFFAAIAVLVWLAVAVARGGLVAAGLIVLAAGCCFGHPFLHVPTGAIPLTVDRALWAGLMILGFAAPRLGAANAMKPGRPEVVLGLLVGVLFLSAFTHDWQANRAMPVSRLFFYYLMPLGMYWVARRSRVTERNTVWTLACLAVFGVYLAVTALAETRQAWWLVYPRYIASTEYGEYFGRGRGPLLNPIGNGMLMGLCLAAMFLFWPRAGRGMRLVLAGAAAVTVLGIYSTLTRSAWMGAGLGLLTVLGLTLPKHWRMPILAGCLVLAVAVSAARWDRIVAFKRDRHLSARETAASVRLRPILATVAWKMFLDRPLFGCGFGQYIQQRNYYLADRSTELPLENARHYVQHNVFLAILVETGLAGMGLFVLLLGLWMRDAWRLAMSVAAPWWARQQAVLFLALLANYAVNGMFHDVAIMPVINMLLFFAAGLMESLRSLTEIATQQDGHDAAPPGEARLPQVIATACPT